MAVQDFFSGPQSWTFSMFPVFHHYKQSCKDFCSHIWVHRFHLSFLLPCSSFRAASRFLKHSAATQMWGHCPGVVGLPVTASLLLCDRFRLSLPSTARDSPELLNDKIPLVPRETCISFPGLLGKQNRILSQV